MNKVVVDSNIIFAALRGETSKAREYILNSTDQFYAPNFLVGEIFKYKEKILKNSSATEEETLEFLFKILNRIHFINEESISIINFITAYKLCKDVDEKDTPFVALALEIDCPLWTRDKALKNGLHSNGFQNFFEEPA